jgi:ABC-2 type transport system permease protein
MLCFSNVVSGLSTFYLAEDLELVLALPVSRTTFHYARLASTLGQTSGAIVVFGLPVFLAYGVRIGAGGAYYLALAFTLGCLTVLASALGVTVATVLVNVFPARRTRELMVLLGALMVTALFVLFRTLQPERLLDTSQFANLAGYLRELSVPAPVLFPPRWGSALLGATLLHAPTPWIEAGLLGMGALAMTSVARWTTAWGFDGGWVRSQEARSAKFHTSRSFDLLAALAPAAWRPLVAKDLRVFARDPGQWSQVFLLAGTCAIYLVSISAVPVDGFKGPVLEGLRSGITFMGLGMAGFMMAAVAVRFAFVAIGREARSWWLVRGAPVEPEVVLRAKALPSLLPMLAVGEVIVVGGGLTMQAKPWLVAVEAGACALLAWGIVHLAVAMGAVWADFKTDSVAQAASSPTAFMFLFASIALTTVVLALVAAGAWAVGKGMLVAGVVGFVAAGAVCVAVSGPPVRWAARTLWERGLP